VSTAGLGFASVYYGRRAEMGADLKQIRREARATVERYRQSGVVMTDAQARTMEEEIEQALIRAWAEQRVRQMASAQIVESLRSVRRTIDRIAPVVLQTLGS
jgi:hypothetical protein